MIADIINYQILGISVIRILGIITYLSFVFTAAISILNKKGVKLIDFQWHPRLALISLILASIHAFLVFLAYLL